MNKYPLWKNVLLILVFAVAVLYALPNFFGETPAIQLSSTIPGAVLTNQDVQRIQHTLTTDKIAFKSVTLENKNVIARFADTDAQFQAKTELQKDYNNKYIIALNLETATPTWLLAIGARPMKLGLDLRGGVHLLLQVDVNSVLKLREKGAVRNIGGVLRGKRVRYSGIAARKSGGISVRLRTPNDVSKAKSLLDHNFPEFVWDDVSQNGSYQLAGRLLPSSLQKISQNAVEKTMTTLRRRVNELGVSEAVVQQEGRDRVSVDLPGIQDAAQAKDILGKTATLEFHLVDVQHDAAAAVGGYVPAGSLLYTYEGRPVLLDSQVILTGDSITNANASFDSSARPMVGITLGGGHEALFERATAENVGRALAVVYVETKSSQVTVNGQTKIIYKPVSRVINVATIQSALGTNFQVTGLSSPVEAKNLALLLRAGSLPAAVTIVEERTIGPSMGQRNIHLGMLSLEVGMAVIIIFMALYYLLFGVLADVGLLINLVLLVAILSVLGATLTFPGIAGIVLTIGMAVDYNVLIYERIREELRNGSTPQPAIHTGYDRAFVTILDANVTTLIVALILFALGTGPVKGFAITLTIGLFTSIISSVTYTRALVNWLYGSRRVKHLSIGIKTKDK
ncbi:MAG: protein translocase subunit SecD [Pseudomonadota bacterium]|nr:protein translocase subunit SecD [Gammaproteobacteria bacterium]